METAVVGPTGARKRLRIATNDELLRSDEGDAGAAARHARSATFNELTPDKPDVPGLSSGLSPWTGGRIWESSRHLADYLAALGKDDWGRTRVVELGAGCGLVGLTCAALGAAEVVLTDQVLHVAQVNADRNFTGAERERIALQPLRWGDAADIAAVKGGQGRAFDLIAASDVLYNVESHDALAETMAALSTPGTVVLLCTPDGSPTFPHQFNTGSVRFYDRMRELGFDCDDITAEAGIASEVDFRGPVSLARMTMTRGGGCRL